MWPPALFSDAGHTSTVPFFAIDREPRVRDSVND
jgi:hypothetical protein